MPKLNKTVIGLAASASIMLSGGLAIALDAVEHFDPVDQRVLRACERDVQARSPQGRRDMMVLGYGQESPRVGVVTGSLMTRISADRWERVRWTCRFHPESRRVLRTEFSWAGSGSRLMAAASVFR